MEKISLLLPNPSNEIEEYEFEIEIKNSSINVFCDDEIFLTTRCNSYEDLKNIIAQKLMYIEQQELENLNSSPVVSGNWRDIFTFNKNAFTIDELIQLTSNFSKKRSPRCRTTLYRTEPKFGRWIFKVRCSESYSNPSGHLTRIQLSKDFEGDNVSESEIFVSCSCPAWTYWGPDYNAHTNKYLEGKPRSNLKTPDVRDPGRNNLICKHVASAGGMFKGFIFPVVYRDRYKDYVDEVRDKRNLPRASREPVVLDTSSGQVKRPQPRTNEPDVQVFGPNRQNQPAVEQQETLEGGDGLTQNNI